MAGTALAGAFGTQGCIPCTCVYVGTLPPLLHSVGSTPLHLQLPVRSPGHYTSQVLQADSSLALLTEPCCAALSPEMRACSRNQRRKREPWEPEESKGHISTPCEPPVAHGPPVVPPCSYIFHISRK